MIPEMIEEGVIRLGILSVYLLALAAGCMIADFVLPHIRPIEQYLESLPEFDDDEELARRYEKINCKRAGCRNKKMPRKSKANQKKRIQAIVKKFL